MYFTDETLDEWAENMDLDRRLWEAKQEETEPETGILADLAHEHEQATCEHDWDEEAGGTQVQHSGAFELLDVCVKCKAVRHTGRWTSVL